MKKFFKKTTAIVLAALTLGTNFSQASATSSINFTNKKIWPTIVAAGGGLITGGGIIAIVLSKYYNYELTKKQESLDTALQDYDTILSQSRTENRKKLATQEERDAAIRAMNEAQGGRDEALINSDEALRRDIAEARREIVVLRKFLKHIETCERSELTCTCCLENKEELLYAFDCHDGKGEIRFGHLICAKCLSKLHPTKVRPEDPPESAAIICPSCKAERLANPIVLPITPDPSPSDNLPE